MKFDDLSGSAQNAFRTWCAQPTSNYAFEELAYHLFKDDVNLVNDDLQDLVNEYKSEKEAWGMTKGEECFAVNGALTPEYIEKYSYKLEDLREFYKYLDKKNAIRHEN